MNNLYLLTEPEYKNIFKDKSYAFKKDILVSNFNILMSKILGQIKLILNNYNKEWVNKIESIENKLKIVKFMDNNFLFNKLYMFILEYQNIFENDINKYLDKKETLFNTVYNIALGICNNKNLLEKIKKNIKEYKNNIDKSLYNFIMKFIKTGVLERIILLVKFLKKRFLKMINKHNIDNKMKNILNKINFVIIFKINKLLIYIIKKISEADDIILNNLKETDIINLKVALSFIKIMAEEINKEILKHIEKSIREQIDESEDEDEDEDSSDGDNKKNEIDNSIYLIKNINSDYLEILNSRNHKIQIDTSSIKYIINYNNLMDIYKEINWESNFNKILEIKKMKIVLDIIKDLCEKEFDIKKEIFDNYLQKLFEIYLNKEKITNIFTLNSNIFTDLFNNTKHIITITNRYFKLELEK